MVKFVVRAQPVLKLIGNHGVRIRRDQTVGHRKRQEARAGQEDDADHRDGDERPTTGQATSQSAIVQLMARVAVGSESEQRTPTAAMKAAIARVPDDPGDIRCARSRPPRMTASVQASSMAAAM